MNKTELVKAIARETSLTQSQANEAIRSFEDVVRDTVASGEKVSMLDFGVFEPSKRAARKFESNVTKKVHEVPEHFIPFFRVSKSFKEYVRGNLKP